MKAERDNAAASAAQLLAEARSREVRPKHSPLRLFLPHAPTTPILEKGLLRSTAAARLRLHRPPGRHQSLVYPCD